jgi:hypothetical protein
MLKHVLRPHAGASLLVAVAALMVGTVAEATPDTNFVSKRYGYSMALVGGSARYLMSPAQAAWSGGQPTPGVDPASIRRSTRSTI